MQDIPSAREQISRLIEAGDRAAAEQALGTALRRWPEHPAIKVLQGEFLARCGQVEAAAESYTALAREHQEFFWAGVRLVRLLHENRRIAEAHAAFAAFVWPSEAPDDVKSKLLAQIAGRGIEPAAAERLLTGLHDAAPTNPEPLARLAAIHARQRRYADALALLEQAASLGAVPWQARLLLIDLLIGAGRVAEALPIAEQAHDEHPDRAEAQHRLIRTCALLGQSQRAADLIASGLHARPHDWMLLYRANRLPLAPAAAGQLFRQIRALAASPAAADEKWQFQYALACLESGLTQEAFRTLSAIPSGTPAARMSEPLRRAIASRPAASWRAPARFDDDRSRDVQIVRVAGATATILVFTGLGGRLAYLPVGHLDTLLAAFAAHVVYLRDVRSRAYLSGIASLGPLPDTLAHLQHRVTELGAPRLATLGNSIGGFGAVRYAARLGAAATLSFAGPTTLDSSVAPDLALAAEAHSEPGVRELEMQDVAENDLVPDIAGSPTMRVTYCFGAASAPELAHGRRIEAFANVVLRPVPGCDDHFVPLHVIARGEFEVAALRRTWAGARILNTIHQDDLRWS